MSQITKVSDIIKLIEAQIKMPLEEALASYFEHDSITSLALQRKMQFLSENQLDRKLVAQLCKAFDK